MINLFHGDDIVSSRKAIPPGALRYDVAEITPDKLEQLRTGNRLFTPTQDVYLWAGKKLALTQLKKFPGAQVKEFPVRRILWQFLNTRKLKDLEACLTTEPVELVWYLLHRQASQKGQNDLLKKMFAIEYNLKSGATLVPLRTHLELLIS